MLSNEQFNAIIEDIRNNVPGDSRALISDNLTTLMANQSASINSINEWEEKYNKEHSLNEELLLTNGKLFQKIGSQTTKPEENIDPEKPKEEKIINITDVINEKGEMI